MAATCLLLNCFIDLDDTQSLPAELRVPGAKYCDNADCDPTASGESFSGKSSGTIFPPQPWGSTQGWQGLLGQFTPTRK